MQRDQAGSLGNSRWTVCIRSVSGRHQARRRCVARRL